MTQQEFDRLSERFLKGECSTDEVALLREWADLHFSEQSEARLFSSTAEETQTRTRLWSSLQVEKRERVVRLRSLVWLAASLLLGALGLFLFVSKTRPTATDNVAQSVMESPGASSKVTLPDGSTVILEEGADIVADKDFGMKDRRVVLKGEAFFEVKPDREHPFIVVTEDLVTEVLGTSFRIKPETGLRKIEVSVHTGKVSVYTAQQKGQRKKDGVIAMPNQKVSYDLISKTLTQNLVDLPRPLAKTSKPTELVFDEASVETILAQIGERYGVQLIAGNPAIARCTFTGDLNGLDMYRQIGVICEVVGLEYEIRGTTVFVSGSGCPAD